MRKFLLGSVVLFFGLTLGVQDALSEGTLIASYSLNQTAVDQTGKNGDIILVNTLFEDGGVYLNGNYVGTDPDSSKIETLPLTALDFSAFSVRIEFKVGELPSWVRPILYCGSSWRYMGVNLNSSGQLFLSCNTISGPASTQTVTLDAWHTIVVTWDGTAGHLFFDGEEVASKVFTPNFNNDRRFVSHNGGIGKAFKGHLRNLAVYNGVISRVVGASGVETPVVVQALRNYPNPFNPSTTIAFSLEAPTTASLEVFDLSGRYVATLLKDEMLGQGPHGHVWNGTDQNGRHLPSGTYFYRFEAGDFLETKRMTLVK